MKNILFILLIAAIWPLSALSQTPTPTKFYAVFGGTSSTPVPVTGKKWKTYTDKNYGFSFRYLLGDEDKPLVPNVNGFKETEITIPTLYEKGPVYLFSFTAASVEKWNHLADSPDNDGDGEPFVFPFKKLQKALQLPVGSECHVPGYGKVAYFNGVKAILQTFEPEEGTALEKVYFIHRGNTRWLGIGIRSYETDENPYYDQEPLTPEQRVKDKNAVEAVLRTFKFFKPKKKEKDK